MDKCIKYKCYRIMSDASDLATGNRTLQHSLPSTQDSFCLLTYPANNSDVKYNQLFVTNVLNQNPNVSQISLILAVKCADPNFERTTLHVCNSVLWTLPGWHVLQSKCYSMLHLIQQCRSTEA